MSDIETVLERLEHRAEEMKVWHEVRHDELLALIDCARALSKRTSGGAVHGWECRRLVAATENRKDICDCGADALNRLSETLPKIQLRG